MKVKKFLSLTLLLVCMVCLGLSFGMKNVETAKAQDPVTESVTITNVHNRFGGDQRLLLMISENDYESPNTDITAKIANSNVLDYVNVYTSKTEYKTLREIYQGNAQANIWGEANSVGFSVDANYHGTAVYAVEIKAGAVFPSIAGDKTYVVAEDVICYNNDYQSTNTALNDFAISWRVVKPVTEKVTVTNIHNRKGGDQRLLIFLSNSNYQTTADITDKIAITNVLDYVNVYTSKTEYKTLREIYQNNAVARIWENTENSIAFAVDANYHGTAVYAVEIKAGATFPSSANEYDKYVVKEDVICYNNDYQSTNTALNDFAISWRVVKPVTEKVTVANIHNRKGGDQRLLIFLSNSNYQTSADITDKIAITNVLDYVNVYTSKTEYKTLREIYQNNAVARIWDNTENSVAFAVDANYHGTAVYAVEIKAGATFPSSANEYDKYVVGEDIIYYNNSYQVAGSEGFAISWTTVKPVEPETIAMDDKIAINTWGEPESEPGITWMHVSLTGFTSPAVEWNSATEAQIAKNNGVNPLDFVYINGEPARTHIDTNSTAMTLHTYSGWTEAFVVKVNKTYLDLGEFTFQLKAGFTLAGADGNFYVLQNDTKVYGWNNGVFGEYVEPVIPEIGTPDVEFVQIHNNNNNSVWGGSTRAIRLTFDKNFTAKAYDANEGGYEAPLIAAVRNFTKINGQSLGNVSFLQAENENSITFLYDESLLAVPAGQDYTTFTIEAGAPFGGRYLPAVTLYLVDGVWCENKPVTKNVSITGIQNRYGADQRLVLLISQSDYPAADGDITAKIENTNVLDYVYVYTSETEYVTLRKIYQKKATSSIWETTNSVAFAVAGDYHGTAVYAVKIKAGAEFPAATNDYTTYVTTEDIVYYNVNYNGDSSINGLSLTWIRMNEVTLEGELATGETSVKLYVVPGQAFAYPEAYSKTQEGDENTFYVYNWYLNGELYDFNTPVTGDIKLTADGTFTAYYSYNVTFNDGKTQNTITVGGGLTVAQPEAPTKEETVECRYVFKGWYNGEEKWDFNTPINENVVLTAKYDQIKKLVLSDLYVEGKASDAIKTGEIKITRSGDHYKGYLGNNVYFDLSLELSYSQLVELATFDVKITNEAYSEGNTSPFYLSWHVYYQRPAGTLYIEYHKYNKETGARETITAVASSVQLAPNEIYQANFAYRVIDEATGLVELYSNIVGWENTLTWELGAEYFATATNHEYLAFATEASVPEMDITFADPGLTGAPHYDVTFKDGDTTIMADTNNQIQLPSIDGVAVEEGLSQVFVGWTTNLETLPNLYPAGYKLKITEETELYAVWIGFEMEDGASVRLTTGSSGIRFTTNVDSEGYKKLGDYILWAGTFVVPTEYLAKAEFVHSSFGAGYFIDEETETWREQGEEARVWTYAAAFVNISKKQYARSFSARGYLKINFTSGEGYVYTPYSEEDNARSIYEVATAAYNDTEKNYKNNAQILEYVNSVVDIALSDKMELDKMETAVGDYTLSSSLEGNEFKVTLTIGDLSDSVISAAMINGTRIVSGVAKNVQIGNFIFSINDVAIDGSILTFTVNAAAELNDKYSDDNTYFRSSDADLDFFLNDYFTRHATGITKNDEDQSVNSVVAGENAEEFFWWEWFSTAYYIMDTDAGFDRIEGLREKLATVPVDDYGYVWQNTDAVRDAMSTLASAEHRMGWPFPTANEMVVKESIKTSLLGSATNYITKGYSTSWDFNGGDRTAWSSNINAALDGAGLFKGTASGANKVTFSSPTLPQTHTIKKYGITSVTVYDEPAIYTYYAPLLELDVRMSNADNVKDIVVYFKTNEGGATEYAMSVNEYAFIKYDYSGKYEHLLYLPMYAHTAWGDSETRYVTDLRIEIIPKDGKTLTGDFALSYVRPSLDTRHTNNNSIFISSLRQDYEYTQDLAFLEQNITRARKAMNFLMQFYDADRSLLDSSYLVGHDADKTGSDAAERAAHSLGNGYWDISYMPKFDFHSNSYFYKAVADMAYLESVLAQKGSEYASDAKKADASVKTAGRPSKSKSFGTSEYSALDLEGTQTKTLAAIQAPTSQNGFWDDSKGRFVAGYGDADANGTSEWVDYGYVVWNLEAIYYGIATESQATLIMQWVTGERTVAGDTSTGEDIYFFELAPRATTYQGSSKTDSSVYTGVWHGTNNGGEYGKSQVQHGGAIMYSSYYDLMNRIAVNGADDAYTRLNAIKDWYMDVYAYYQTSGSTPDDFYWDYYENSQWDSNGDGKGEYWRVQNGIKGQAEREGWTGGVIGIDGEFLESFLPVAAIPYGFFGIEAQNGTLQIAPKLPGDLDFWTAENLTFAGCKYDVTIYENALQISAVRGEVDGLKLKVALDAPTGDYEVYVNGFATTEYVIVNGQIVVEIAFGNAIVEVR